MEKDYEIALSYAHKDEKIARIIKEELENIFANRFFMDVYRQEELASAEEFEEKLRSIFRKTNYSIILYSKNYRKGKFTHVEKEEILKCTNHGEEPHLFIININDCDVSKFFLKNLSYMLLNVSYFKTKKIEIDKKIHDIIHNQIKKCMIKQSIKEKKREKEYSLNVQTLFSNGNVALWKKDYDWNLLGRAYIDENGRKIREGTKWDNLWQYIETDFLLIKKNLEPDTIRKIRLNCHLSIACKLGKIYGDLGQASGNRNLKLISSNRVKDIVFTFEKEMHYTLSKDFNICQEYEGNSSECEDIVCIISIKPNEQGNILETVKCYMEEQGQKYRKICLFKEKRCIEDANTLESMAIYLRENMIQHRTGNKCKIHLFPDTTAPLMFAIGARSIFSGKIQLYEYIPEDDSYVMSLTL